MRKQFLIAITIAAGVPLGQTLSALAQSTPTAPPAQSATTSAPSVADLLPVGTFKVNVVAPTASPQARMLIDKSMRALSLLPDKAWLLEHAKKSKPGEPWKYDPRLGLTPAEYQKAYFDLGNVELRNAGVFNLSVTAKDGVYYLDGGDALPELKGLSIDTRKDSVTTPTGTTQKGERFDKVMTRPLEFGRRWQVIKGFNATTPAAQQQGSATYLILGKELPSKPLKFDDFLVWLDTPPPSGARPPHAVLLFSTFSANGPKTNEQNLMLTYSLPPEKALDSNDPLLAISLCGLARMYAEQQMPEKSQAAINQSVTMMRKVNDPKALQLYIEALFRMGRRAEVAEFRKKLKEVTPPPATDE